MSCAECTAAQERGDCYPYRVGNGNVLVSGCKAHVKQLFEEARQ